MTSYQEAIILIKVEVIKHIRRASSELFVKNPPAMQETLV